MLENRHFKFFFNLETTFNKHTKQREKLCFDIF
jgi:hypothetical protein